MPMSLKGLQLNGQLMMTLPMASSTLSQRRLEMVCKIVNLVSQPKKFADRVESVHDLVFTVCPQWDSHRS